MKEEKLETVRIVIEMNIKGRRKRDSWVRLTVI